MEIDYKVSISEVTIEAILGILREAGRPLSTNDVVRLSGKSYATIDRVLKQVATRLPGHRAYWIYPEVSADEWNSAKADIAKWLKGYDPNAAPFKADVEKLEWLAKAATGLHIKARNHLDTLPK